MKTILGITASPRKLGNCELMIKEIGAGVDVPHTLKLLRLPEFNILHCRACYQCLFKDGKCSQKDDFYQVLDAIRDADALILAAPAYFLGAGASLKLFLDRGLSLYAHTDALWGKPAVGVAVAGIPGREGYTLLAVQSFLKLILADLKQSAVIYGALPGEIFLNDDNRRTAAALGAALFKETPKPAGPTCPLCGGDTFRFLGDNHIRCMLCSNAGALRQTPDGPVFDVKAGPHDFFLTKQNVIDHGQWLRSMKHRFMEHKTELKAVTLPYLKGWEWIKPEKE